MTGVLVLVKIALVGGLLLLDFVGSLLQGHVERWLGPDGGRCVWCGWVR
jgi:hypothetical protein